MNILLRCAHIAGWCTDIMMQPEVNRPFREEVVAQFVKEIHDEHTG